MRQDEQMTRICGIHGIIPASEHMTSIIGTSAHETWFHTMRGSGDNE
jgi:hypothetical protein